MAEPTCWTRKCKHFIGIMDVPDIEEKQKDGTIKFTLSAGLNYCSAFPDGIPNKIAYGKNLHLKPVKGQGNKIVYEQGERQE